MPNTPSLIGAGSVFIDDIVLPSGQTHMGQLGGGVVHALMGVAMWDERPGLIGFVGQGIPQNAASQIQQYFDINGLHHLEIPQMRAWQVFEEAGTRRELYRVEEILPFIEGPQPHHIPHEYQTSQAIYLIQNFDGIQNWNPFITKRLSLWEPLQQIMIPGSRAAFRKVLKCCHIDIVSPNLLEAQALYGKQAPEKLVHAILDDGANVVALRMGEEGSLLGSRKIDEQHVIDAIPVIEVIDQTGAGNTYCGAFLLGVMRGLSLREAGCMASVAASFCIEQIGVLNPNAIDRDERERRYQLLIEKS